MLAAQWIVDNGEMPPLKFSELLPQIGNSEVLDAIKELLNIKSKENEPYMHERLGFLEEYIAETLAYCESGTDKFEKIAAESEKLDLLFRKTLKEIK